MIEKSFTVFLEESANRDFAELSGDWNPIHTNMEHSKTLGYSSPILHGAYCAALISRLAGMHLPGTDCLLERIQINFLKPIVPPIELEVFGTQSSHTKNSNHVEVKITDRRLGALHCTGSYNFSKRTQNDPIIETIVSETETLKKTITDQRILLTGSHGSLGQRITEELGDQCVPLNQELLQKELVDNSNHRIKQALGDYGCRGIVMCGWPSPDNQTLLSNDNIAQQIENYITQPLHTAILLGKTLAEIGKKNSSLILIGSTYSKAGKHAWKHPLYSLGKSFIPTLVQILGIELGVKRQKIVGVEFDVIDGGMNAGMSNLSKQMNSDRSPFGKIATPSDAAKNILWLMSNNSFLMNGSTITLSGGALP